MFRRRSKPLEDLQAEFETLKRQVALNAEKLDQLDRFVRLGDQKLDHLAWQVDLLTRETRLLLGRLSLPPTELWRGRPVAQPGEPGASVFAASSLCRQQDFEQPYFAYWCRRLAAYLSYHRKVWEYVFICQALWERGAIRPAARALGFGVGREPLAAFFASEDCEVTATDVEAEAAVERGWATTGQHASGLEALRNEYVCPQDKFDRHVAYEVCDMNAVPDHLTGFDFCWSSCALEHLGSIEHGFAFIERSLACLKPGGWAAHTTEFNLSSNDHTLTEGATVLFRQQDMEALAARLAAGGHRLAPFDFDAGLAPLDRYVDVPPYRAEPHLKLALAGYAVTSIGIIVQRGPA